jgi:hypothetical protein
MCHLSLVGSVSEPSTHAGFAFAGTLELLGNHSAAGMENTAHLSYNQSCIVEYLYETHHIPLSPTASLKENVDPCRFVTGIKANIRSMIPAE